MSHPPNSLRLATLKTLAVFVALTPLAITLHAVDPLPPELESAPLERQTAWRQKLGRESMEERQRVAIARHEQGLALKKHLVAGMREEAASRRLEVLTPVPAPLPVVESGISNPAELGWLALSGTLGIVAYMIRRWMRSGSAAKS